jgi:DNA repair exonuclease SbcCD ATPase subunit
MFRLTKLTVQDFGPFVNKHSVDLPENGLSLIRGKVLETGDGSGAGKSYLLNAISYVLGFCPFPGTELQSWYTDEPPQASLEILTDKGKLTLTRKKGLTLKSDFLPEKEYRGKAAEAQLDAVFGMDKKLREQATYRPQGAPGLFLEMDDAEKKSFLAKVLDLEKYELVADQAAKTASKLEQDCELKKSTYNIHLDAYAKANKRLKDHVHKDNADDLIRQKDNILRGLEDLRARRSVLGIQIETVRKTNSNELEAVLSGVRTKVTQVNSRGESVEATALKAELQKQQQRLEKCRQYDQDKKLEVQKQRDALKYQLKEIEVEHRRKVAEKVAEYDREISRHTTEIAKFSHCKMEQGALSRALTKLLEQKCPTCGQMWEDAQQQITITQQKIEENKCLQQCLLEYGYAAKLEEGNKKTYLEGAQKELEKALDAAKSQLSNIKDPEPHPVGIQVQTKIVELTKDIKDLEISDRAKKQKDLEAVFAEEKDIKAQFRLKLDNEVEELQVELFGIETELTKNSAELAKVNNEISYITKEVAVHKELEKSFKDAMASMELAYSELESIRGKMALESDVAALVGYKGFLGVIFSDVLDEIATQTNDILSKVANVRHLTMDFETEKEAVTSGNVALRITPVIYSKGRKVSYKGGISGGMRTAVQLAVDLAVGNVVSSRMSSYPSFLILDEALDGLGEIAKEAALTMLQEVAGDRLVLVVDHSSSLANLFNQVIEVEQIDGVSRIV